MVVEPRDRGTPEGLWRNKAGSDPYCMGSDPRPLGNRPGGNDDRQRCEVRRIRWRRWRRVREQRGLTRTYGSDLLPTAARNTAPRPRTRCGHIAHRRHEHCEKRRARGHQPRRRQSDRRRTEAPANREGHQTSSAPLSGGIQNMAQWPAVNFTAAIINGARCGHRHQRRAIDGWPITVRCERPDGVRPRRESPIGTAVFSLEWSHRSACDTTRTHPRRLLSMYFLQDPRSATGRARSPAAWRIVRRTVADRAAHFEPRERDIGDGCRDRHEERPHRIVGGDGAGGETAEQPDDE